MSIRTMSATVFLAAFFAGGCGRHQEPSSRLSDEVDPTGEHEYHYFGKVEFFGRDVRRFPDALTPEFNISARTVNQEFSAVVPTASIPIQGTITKDVKVLKGQAVTVFYSSDDEAVDYQSVVPNQQNFLIRVETKRIDVNDMLITRQDGSTYYARGEYNIYVTDAPTWILYQKPTKTGLDVPVGHKYQVDVSATSEEGVVQKQSFTLDYSH